MFDQRKFWISALVIIGATSYIETAYLKFYHGSLENYTVTPLEEPLKILPYFNKLEVSVFYVHGFNETADDFNVKVVPSAYLTKNYANVILLDWAQEVRRIDEQSYALIGVPNARIVGNEFGRSLVTLIQNGVDEDKIHIVGHSLGAHLAGYAGTKVQECHHNISRITGLDPGGRIEKVAGTTSLKSSDAQFVDILHTDYNIFGVNHSMGIVDFWANCGSTVQPACDTDNSSTTLKSLCSHQLSCKIFAEAILTPTSYPAAHAANCTEWHLQCDTSDFIYLGDTVDRSARGNFYFSTNSEYPLSRGEAGLKPNN